MKKAIGILLIIAGAVVVAVGVLNILSANDRSWES